VNFAFWMSVALPLMLVNLCLAYLWLNLFFKWLRRGEKAANGFYLSLISDYLK